MHVSRCSMVMSSRGIYGRRAGHGMPRRTLTSPLYLPLPMSILVQYPHAMTRQEHASLTSAAGQRCMSLTCAAPSSSAIRRETGLLKRRACLLPRTVILHALSSHTAHAYARAPSPPTTLQPYKHQYIHIVYILYILSNTGVKQE